MEQVELRTQHEIERERKHRAIINDYLELANQHPGCAATRLMNKVAEMHGMTSMGVRRILERNNILSNN